MADIAVRETNPSKLISLQALRGIAFLGIVSFHCNIGNQGALCVSIFFVLSGFVLAFQQIRKNNFLKADRESRLLFALNHIRKLYPLHLIMLCADIYLSVYNGYQLRWLLDNEISKIIPNILLLQSWYPLEDYYFAFNGATWFLSTMVFLYYMFPLLFNKICRWETKNTPYTVLVLMILFEGVIVLLTAGLSRYCSIGDNFGKWITYICPLFRTLDFAIGVCLGRIYCNGRKQKCRKSISIVMTIITVLLMILELRFFELTEEPLRFQVVRYSFIYILSSVLIVYLFTREDGICYRLYECKILVILGDLSGYGFVIHQIVIEYVKYFLPYENKYFIFIITILITLFLSFAYKRIIDKYNFGMRRSHG